MAMASASLSSSLVSSARPSVACRQMAFSPLPARSTHRRVSRARSVAVRSMLSEDQAKAGDKKKKFITREEEPEQYWQTEAEREGRSPMQSVLPYIAILGLLTPFAILGLAFANGWIEPR